MPCTFYCVSMFFFFFPFSFFELELIFAVSFGINRSCRRTVEVLIVVIRVKIVESIIVCWAMEPMRRVSAKYVVLVLDADFAALSAPCLVRRIRNVHPSLVSALYEQWHATKAEKTK